MTYLVALHGLPRAGKGTIADALCAQRGFTRFSFGDAVYAEVSRAFGVRAEELRSNEWKTTPQNILSNRCADSVLYRAMLEGMDQDPAAPRTSRYHLRYWATEFRRKRNPMYWVERLAPQLRGVKGDIVIDDLRFEDTEYPYLRQFSHETDRRFRVIEVVRPGYQQQEGLHSSDTRLSAHRVDLLIENHEGMASSTQAQALDYLYHYGE